MSEAMRRAHKHKGQKRWHGGEPTTTSGGKGRGTTIDITMTGTGTRMTMTTDIVTSPTTIAIAPSGSGSDTTYVVVMPTDGSGGDDSGASATASAAFASATGGASNQTLMTMTFGSEVFTFTNGGSLPTGISDLSSMLAAQTALTGLGNSTASPAASAVTQNVAVLTIAAGTGDSAAQSRTGGDGDGGGAHTAAIVGATLGAAAFLIGLVAAVLAVLALLRRRSQREKDLLAAASANQYAQSNRGSHYPQTDAGNRQSQYPATEGPRSRPASPTQ